MKFDDIIYWEKKDSYKEGEAAGRESAYREMIITLLQAHGEVPSDIKDKINVIEDTGILQELVKEAAGAVSIEEFEVMLKQYCGQEEQRNGIRTAEKGQKEA